MEQRICLKYYVFYQISLEELLSMVEKVYQLSTFSTEEIIQNMTKLILKNLHKAQFSLKIVPHTSIFDNETCIYEHEMQIS